MRHLPSTVHGSPSTYNYSTVTFVARLFAAPSVPRMCIRFVLNSGHELHRGVNLGHTSTNYGFRLERPRRSPWRNVKGVERAKCSKKMHPLSQLWYVVCVPYCAHALSLIMDIVSKFWISVDTEAANAKPTIFLPNPCFLQYKIGGMASHILSPQ